MDVGATQGEFGLRDYLGVLKRRKRPVVATVVTLVGLTLVLSLLQTPMYAAEAKVVLRQDSGDSVFSQSGNGVVDPARVVQTEMEMLQSKPVEDKVRDTIGSAPKVSVRPVPQADVIIVRATSKIAERAATVANTYAQAYVDVRRERAINDLVAAAKQIQGTISDLQRQIDQAPDEQQRSRLRDQQGVFREKLDQLQVDSQLKRGGAELASPATPPTSAFAPKPVRNSVLALGISLFLGVGLAFLFEFLDDTVRGKGELERATPGLEVLGLIPSVPTWKVPEDAVVVSSSEPASPPAEAYRTLRTALQFLTLDREMRTIQITSASAGEGKSTTLANLGVAFARAGRPVVLVCCDLRRPRIHEFFGLTNRVGLTSVLLKDATLEQAIQQTSVERLRVLASGPLPPNPSELLASRHVVELLERIKQEGHLVLIDSPPILPVTDGMVLSKSVDATLLVANAGRTTRHEMARAVELLEQVDAPLVGAVLNGVTETETYGYSYQYSASSTNGKAPGRGQARSTPRANGRRARPRRKVVNVRDGG
jgi:capsular exopolysaccharide synthesis family protein